MRFADPRDHHAGKGGLAGQFAVDVGLAFHAPGAGPERKHVDLEAQLVAGYNGAAKLGALNAGEDHQLFFAVGELGHDDDGAGLGHGFHHQHAGHDGKTGEVALEERLVDGHVLDGYHALGGLELDDAVEQQKRIAVGQEIHDLLDV